MVIIKGDFTGKVLNMYIPNLKFYSIRHIKCTQHSVFTPNLWTKSSFFPVVFSPRHKSHLWSCLTLHSSGESLGSVAPGMSSSVIGMLSREIGSFSFSEKLLDLQKLSEFIFAAIFWCLCLPKRSQDTARTVIRPQPPHVSAIGWWLTSLWCIAR